MNIVLAVLASIGVVLLFTEIWGSYLLARITARRQLEERYAKIEISLYIQYWRVALILVLELGVYVAWITNKLLG
jgi:hypothetical protein